MPLKAVANTNAGGSGPTVEQTYQKLTQHEHILQRPDTYVGSIEPTTAEMWVMDEAQQRMVQRKVTYVPGMYKIFDEILVNAADNKQRDDSMTELKIDIDRATNRVSVYNNGRGIPVAIHKEHNIYVPELIFGNLLTSSNYNDQQKKVTGGRNGYGARVLGSGRGRGWRGRCWWSGVGWGGVGWSEVGCCALNSTNLSTASASKVGTLASSSS